MKRDVRWLARLRRMPCSYFGSIVSWTPPGDARIPRSTARRLRDRGDVLFIDLRPELVRPFRLLADPGHGQQVAERAIGLAHLAKASSDDIAWLYPNLAPADVARRWLELGATMVIITSSADGACAYTAQGWSNFADFRARRGQHDTVGAGDFRSPRACSDRCSSRGQYTPADLARYSADQLSGALDDAILVASLNCERRGNDPPTAADVEAGRERLKPI